jgi:hypothetical protein
VLTSPTEDLGKLLACLHGLQPAGPSQFIAGIKTAMASGGGALWRATRPSRQGRVLQFRAPRPRRSVSRTPHAPPPPLPQIALKHRKNKHGGQRVVAFVGSPLGAEVTEEELKKLGAALKKSNVSRGRAAYHR